jgi:hypothetical protein
MMNIVRSFSAADMMIALRHTNSAWTSSRIKALAKF